MKLNTRKIKDFLQITKEYIDEKSYKDIYKKIRIQIKEGTITLSIVSSSVFLKYAEEVNDKDLNFDVLVDYQVFNNIVSSKEEIDVVLKSNILEIKAISKFKIPIELCDAYPDFPKVSGEKLELDITSIRKSISNCISFLDKDEGSGFHDSVILEIKNNKLYVIASDGLNLICICVGEYAHKDSKIAIPPKNISLLINKISDKIELTFNSSALSVAGSGFVGTILTRNQAHYDYLSLFEIPVNFNITIEKDEMLTLCKTHRIVSLEAHCKVLVQGGMVTGFSAESGSGEAVSSVSASYEGPDISFEMQVNPMHIFASKIAKDKLLIGIAKNRNESQFLHIQSDNCSLLSTIK